MSAILQNGNIYGNSSSSASLISFDDSIAQTGSKNVQGAIESVKSNIKDIKSDLNTCIKTIYKNRTTLAKYEGDTMLNLLAQCSLVLSEVLEGVGTYLISVRGDNTAWRYVGILISGIIGKHILVDLVTSDYLSVSVSENNEQLRICNTHTTYDQPVQVSIVKLAE